MRRAALILIAGLAASPQASAGELSSRSTVPFVRLVEGKRVIAIDEVVGDVVLVSSRIEISGVVRGHLYAIDSEVAVSGNGVVLKPMTVAKGALHIAEGAVLPDAIQLVDAELFGPTGQSVPPSGRLVLGDGATTISATQKHMSPAQLALMKGTVAFDRFTPDADVDIPVLRGWHPGLGMALKKFVEDPSELVVGGVTRLSFVSDKVSGAFQRGYRGERGTVLLTGVRLVDDEAAAALWSEIEAVRPRVKVALSVKSDLGPGAHWFYRNKGRYTMMWQSGRWFLTVETRLDPDGNASVFQQKQFNEQVLDALRLSLQRLAPTPQGVVQ